MKDPLYMKEVFTKWQAWCDLILMAYFTPADFFVRGVKVKAKRGCVYMSGKELEKRWRWSRGKVERFLKYLEDDERIKVKPNNVVNCIAIVNYEKFQGYDGHTNERTNGHTNGRTNGQLYKNDKNDNILFPESASDTGDGILQMLVSQMQELKERLDAQESGKKPKKKEPNPLITKGREVFERRYADLYSNSYYWQAKDAVAMDSLTKKLIYSRQQKGLSIETEGVLEALEAFLSSVSDEWLLKNFSVTNINSKYNEIVAQARAKLINGKQSETNGSDKRRSSEVTATEAKDYEGAF